MKNKLIYISIRIRKERKKRKLTLDDLANKTKLTKGLLSKIENFRTVPSLPVLLKIAQGLDIDASELLKGITEDTEQTYHLIKNNNGKIIERDEATGFLYEMLLEKSFGEQYLQVFLLTIEPNSSRKMVSSDAEQFIYILDGAIEFHLGEDIIALKKGDFLFFDGRIPHLPKNMSNKCAKFLSVYFLVSENR
jgi:transcriptional regulator with XRE-family HTH domain